MTGKENTTTSTSNMQPINSPENQVDWGPSTSPSTIPIDFSPPLIAMVVVVATAFFIVTYFRLISRHLLPPIFLLLQQWRHRWLQWRHHSPSTTSDVESHPSNIYDSTPSYHFFSSYNGLDEEVIKTIPLSIYKNQKSRRDCAVCLLEFEEDDYVRTLPVCAHDFHVDCIDIWLTSHANCPLCRAGIFRPESPFIPLMAARIRPSLDGIMESIMNESQAIELERETAEIVDEQSSRLEDQFNNGRDFLLKRSYSFGFERTLAADRIVMEAATATPWRYRRGNFWSKRPSPFNPLGKPRVFSFRYYRGMKSPFFRRRNSGVGLFPLSESNSRFSGGGSSRRTKSMTSPMFMRSSSRMAAFSSSRLRCRDLEALLSPERLNRRWR